MAGSSERLIFAFRGVWQKASSMFKHFGGSLIFTVFALALGGWYGWELTGTVDGALGILWICAVLAVLEVSLSFDNAAVNASVLKDLDPVLQRRFLTWGIQIDVLHRQSTRLHSRH